MSNWAKGALGKFIKNVAKGKARELAVMWANDIPHPTKENTKRKNSHILIDIRDEFISKDCQQENDILFNGVFNQWIVVNEWDAAWIERSNKLVKRLKEADWEFTYRGRTEPRYQWWLEDTGVPHDVTLLDLLRQERWYAWQRKDGMAMARMKIMENMVQGLPQTNIKPELFDCVGRKLG